MTHCFFSILVSILLCMTSFCAIVPPSAAGSLTPMPVMGAIFQFSGSRPTNLGVKDGGLAPCPATPNCVNSQTRDEAHTIAPLQYDGPPEAVLSRLKIVIQSQPRVKVVVEGDRYLYAEFTSALMGFVDDVEFYVNPGERVIDARSASRLGESDLGVNRQRIETIRAALSKTGG